MTDIADKIYAATGLTLNAEGAAKVGHMIRLARQEAAAEIEKLRAENTKLAASNHAYLSDYQEAADKIGDMQAENEKLRAALRGVLTYYNAPTPAEAKLKQAVLATPIEQARAALGEKE